MANKKQNLQGSLMLTVCAVIWGSSFVAQTTGAEFVGPFTFISLRSLLGSLSLLPVILITDSIKKKNGTYRPLETKNEKRFFVLGSIACGIALCVASLLQQFGIDRGTEPGKAGFITALYILLVPIFSLVFKKRSAPSSGFASRCFWAVCICFASRKMCFAPRICMCLRAPFAMRFTFW